MSDRAIEPAASPEAGQSRDAIGGRQGLAGPPAAAVASQHHVGMAPVRQQLDRVRERTSGERHLVAVALQDLHQRPEHEDVSGVREVDPDAHEDPYGRDARPRIEVGANTLPAA